MVCMMHTAHGVVVVFSLAVCGVPLGMHSLLPVYNSRKGRQHFETDHARKWHKNHYIQVSALCTFVEVYPLSHIWQGLLVGACNYIH